MKENAEAVAALSAAATVLVAIAALLGVKFQVEATGQQQREQSARDIYREFLALSINNPQLAEADFCAITDAKQQAAYENYVEYLLYTAEQVMSVDPDWTSSMQQQVTSHAAYICQREDWEGYTPEVVRLVQDVKKRLCATQPKCG